MQETCTASVIIPAHNEEKVIDRCLRPIKPYIDNNKLEVIVICNGCTDKTASIVTTISDKIICIETDIASKASALNAGDDVAQYFPRFYIDADISISMESIAAVTRVLENHYMAASPEVDMDLSGSSRPVKAYYDVWLSLPYCRAGMVGAGVYALSQVGRNRFKKFPDIISDDGYVRRLFNESERGVVHGCYSRVKAPRNIIDLVKIKTRSRLGLYELKEKFPDKLTNEEKNYSDAFKELVLKPRLWPKILLYITVNLFTRVRAMWQKKINTKIWERDDSNR